MKAKQKIANLLSFLTLWLVFIGNIWLYGHIQILHYKEYYLYINIPLQAILLIIIVYNAFVIGTECYKIAEKLD